MEKDTIVKTKKIKVCGMCDAANIRHLAQLPIDYMGFIFYPQSARYIVNFPQVELPPSIKKVGVFVNAHTDNVMELVTENQLDAVQLHGQESADACRLLQKEGLEVFKAFGIAPNFDWMTLSPYIDCTDYFLFDTKSPQHGGTGVTFDWEILAQYPYDTPYFLSGGLSLKNLDKAIQIDDPRLVGWDLNSKFEIAPGVKDINSLSKALKIIKDE